VAVAADVKVTRAEATALPASAPQQGKTFPAELSEGWWKVRDDQGSETGDRGTRRGRRSRERGSGTMGGPGREGRGDHAQLEALTSFGNSSTDPLDCRSETRESLGELCSLAVSLHALFFERLNPPARFPVNVGHGRQNGTRIQFSSHQNSADNRERLRCSNIARDSPKCEGDIMDLIQRNYDPGDPPTKIQIQNHCFITKRRRSSHTRLLVMFSCSQSIRFGIPK
jgi:hypothetical protein